VKISVNKSDSVFIIIYWHIVIYTSPDTNTENEIELMALLHTASFSTPGTVIMSGDFNYPGINWHIMDPVTHIEKTRYFWTVSGPAS
jgi:hypothetical protein